MGSPLSSLESDLAETGDALARSLDQIIAQVLGPRTGPQKLAEVLDVDKGSASRLLKAIRSRDPIAVTYLIPGPEPLRRLLRAASERGVEPGLIQCAQFEVDRFETLIRGSAGDRATFEGIISELLPEAREQYQNRVKQMLYRGFSQLKGYSVDVDFTAVFIHPSPDGACLDYGVIGGVLGMRRLRPNATVRLAALVVGKQQRPSLSTTLDGQPLEDATSGRLDQFCTAPAAEVQIEDAGGTFTTVLTSAAMGPRSAVDLVLGHRNRLVAPRYSDLGKRTLSGAGVEVDKPAKLLHLDVFVHDTVYTNADPELVMVDTTFRGMANMNDASRLPDRLDVTERIEPLGRGFGSIRASHIKRYSEMLGHVVDTCGWDAQTFRGYRCLIAHPIYGTQVTLGFQLPACPESRAATPSAAGTDPHQARP